jgi:hypothetical protein
MLPSFVVVVVVAVAEIFSLDAISATIFQMTLNSDLALKLGFTRTILRASAIQRPSPPLTSSRTEVLT